MLAGRMIFQEEGFQGGQGNQRSRADFSFYELFFAQKVIDRPSAYAQESRRLFLRVERGLWPEVELEPFAHRGVRFVLFSWRVYHFC